MSLQLPSTSHASWETGFVEREIRKEEIPVLDVGSWSSIEAPVARELVEMENSFENIENDLKEVIASGDALRKTFLELTEMRHVLFKTQQFFDQVSCTRPSLLLLLTPHHETAKRDPSHGWTLEWRWRSLCRRDGTRGSRESWEHRRGIRCSAAAAASATQVRLRPPSEPMTTTSSSSSTASQLRGRSHSS